MAFKMFQVIDNEEPILAKALSFIAVGCLQGKCPEGNMSCKNPYTEQTFLDCVFQ